MNISELRKKASTLPRTPGVYLMQDKQGEIIYVGKAKALRSRVSQYFQGGSNHTYKTLKMVEKVVDFNVINAPTELDALVLENTLIKKYRPKYNILLKDDKGYPFIRLENAKYPRFSVESKREKPGKYFGPYGGRGTANAAVRAVSELFKLPTCSKHFPRDIGKERPCLRYHIGKCCGVCSGNVSEKQYTELVNSACLLLDGKGAALERQLKEEMEKAAQALNFEQAAALRDRLQDISRLRSSTIVSASVLADADALGFALSGSRGCVAALSYSGGKLMDKRIIFFDGADSEDESRNIESFISQYYPMLNTAPKEIYLPCEIEDAETLAQMLTSLRGKKCTLLIPQKGDKAKMVALAKENAAQELSLMEQKEQRSQKTLEELGEMLGIPAPLRIEAFDISNTAGADAVASMTVFQDGKPLKKAYKKFKIKEAPAGDDPRAIAEVLGRRLQRAIDGEQNFLPLPDLLLMDGGITQTLAAVEQVEALNLKIPVFGMVKDNHHRTRGLVNPKGEETGLSRAPAVFALIGRIQEETHRFAVDYHQTVRRAKAKVSELDKIPGIGQARKKALLSHFKTISAIKSATLPELCRIIPKGAAEKVIEYFKGENK